MCKIVAFVEALRDQCDQRERGTDRRGSIKGCHNGKLVEWMEDIRSVADLQALRQSKSSGILRTVDVALRRLEESRLIPTTGLSNACLKASYDAIQRTEEGPTNQQLFKELLGHCSDRAAAAAALGPRHQALAYLSGRVSRRVNGQRHQGVRGTPTPQA